jgi:hypothetical protein
MAKASSLLAAEETERHRRVLVVIDLCTRWDYAALKAAGGTDATPLAGSGPGRGELWPHNHREGWTLLSSRSWRPGGRSSGVDDRQDHGERPVGVLRRGVSG